VTVGNVPERILNAVTIRTTLHAHPMTFYFK
jgi:hypothetical protein